MEKHTSHNINSSKKYIKWGVMTALGLLVVLKGPEIYQNRRNISLIKENRLEYTTDGGWVDRNHATPGGARHLRNRINAPTEIPGTDAYGLVYYGQFQKKLGFKTGEEKTYIVKKRMTKEEMESVALAIFLEVSRAFEEHQEKTDFITGSSYDEADLFSNIIGFYRAVRGYSRDEVEQYLCPVGIDSSLAIYHKRKLGKNKKIGEIITDNNSIVISEKYPYPFNQIRTVRKGKCYNKRGILFKEQIQRNQSSHLTFQGYSDMGYDVFTINPAYEGHIDESIIKQWLIAINPIAYKDIHVLIDNKTAIRKVIVYK